MLERFDETWTGVMGVSRFGSAAVAVVAMMALSACTTTGGKEGASAKTDSAVYIAALQGGIVSRTGVKLSKSETQRALEAEYRALEASAGGQPVIWAGSSVSGQVVAAAPYQVGKQNCRQFTHKLNDGGREIQARGVACRNANGTWTPLS
ncbi:lipoic acid synthetase [Rhizobium sp. PDO1-076]|nr:lipoic acid synthetase [Rhizobium sp. PDO1-076]